MASDSGRQFDLIDCQRELINRLVGAAQDLEHVHSQLAAYDDHHVEFAAEQLERIRKNVCGWVQGTIDRPISRCVRSTRVAVVLLRLAVQAYAASQALSERAGRALMRHLRNADATLDELALFDDSGGEDGDHGMGMYGHIE